jgi:hypothetical protein
MKEVLYKIYINWIKQFHVAYNKNVGTFISDIHCLLKCTWHTQLA